MAVPGEVMWVYEVVFAVPGEVMWVYEVVFAG